MNNLDREKRMTDLDAILARGEHGLKTLNLKFCGKEFSLCRGSADAQYAYVLYEGGEVVAGGGINAAGAENAMEYKMPSVVIHLDEFLNITEMTGTGKPLSPATVEQIIDQMLEEHAAAQLRGLP